MTIHIHELGGCAPTPLAHYLKALGILRLVAEQADPEARGWWEGDRFRLATHLEQSALERFFLEQYQPTPFVSPWNKGSGFFYENDPGLTPAENSTAIRFGRVREGIKASRLLLDELSAADQASRAIKAEVKEIKDKKLKQKLKDSPQYKKRLAEAERKFKTLKADLIPRIRLSWRGPHREWLDVAMVLLEDERPKFPALLGTGGNDGRLDFTNNFMQRLNEVFDFEDTEGRPRSLSQQWFSAALWGDVTLGYQSGKAVGQYLPGMAGGANSGNGPDADSLLNPVDFLLMFEGAVLFTAHATRRLGVSQTSRAAAPFAVGAQGAGYASAADADESARGEQWMPLWSQPITLSELCHLFAEGRAQIGAKSVSEPLDLARAVARLGIARGITSFQRYGYIERNGQANLAVPLGRFRVPDRISPRLACLDDLDAWLPRLRRQARGKEASARLRYAERRLADALFAVVQHPAEANRWQTVLLALAEVEGVLVTGSGFKAGPVPKLRPEWVAAADDGSASFRLAVACALQSPTDSIRRHWLPLGKGGGFATSGNPPRLLVGPEVVLHGRNGVGDAIALVERRLIEAGQGGERRLPLTAAPQAAALPTDLAALVAGQIDLDLTMTLARSLMAIDRQAWQKGPTSQTAVAGGGISYPDDAWLATRLALMPWPLADGRQIGADPAIVRRLASGDGAAAVEISLRRLRAAGIGAAVRVSAVTPEQARLWAAALAFPIDQPTAAAFVRRLDPNAM
jgi:CRISPR-associated protein Csx17